MALLDISILSILFRFKAISGIQFSMVFAGNFIFFWIFNNVFPDIPINNHIPIIKMETFESREISEWIWLRDYFDAFRDQTILKNFFQNNLIPSLSILCSSFFYTLGLKWHRKVKWALISGMMHFAVFIAFPLIENRIFDGLVYKVNMPFLYFGLFFYFVGYAICKFFLYLKKKYFIINDK